MGWSGGAGVAMELIRTHPEQVRVGVLIEPGFLLPRHQRFRSLRVLLSMKRDWMRGRNRATAERMASSFSPTQWRQWLGRAQRPPARVVQRRCRGTHQGQICNGSTSLWTIFQRRKSLAGRGPNDIPSRRGQCPSVHVTASSSRLQPQIRTVRRLSPDASAAARGRRRRGPLPLANLLKPKQHPPWTAALSVHRLNESTPRQLAHSRQS